MKAKPLCLSVALSALLASGCRIVTAPQSDPHPALPIHCYCLSVVDGQRDKYGRPIPVNDWHYVGSVARTKDIPPKCIASEELAK